MKEWYLSKSVLGIGDAPVEELTPNDTQEITRDRSADNSSPPILRKIISTETIITLNRKIRNLELEVKKQQKEKEKNIIAR